MLFELDGIKLALEYASNSNDNFSFQELIMPGTGSQKSCTGAALANEDQQYLIEDHVVLGLMCLSNKALLGLKYALAAIVCRTEFSWF